MFPLRSPVARGICKTTDHQSCQATCHTGVYRRKSTGIQAWRPVTGYRKYSDTKNTHRDGVAGCPGTWVNFHGGQKGNILRERLKADKLCMLNMARDHMYIRLIGSFEQGRILAMGPG